MPFGISSALGHFQQIMDELTRDLPGVAVYLDDILVSGFTVEEHLRNLQHLLKRLENKGLRCRKSKCLFAQPHIEYLGHVLTSNGIAKSSKVDEVIAMPPPTDVASFPVPDNVPVAQTHVPSSDAMPEYGRHKPRRSQRNRRPPLRYGQYRH